MTFKPYLEEQFAGCHSMTDPCVYFYELGLRRLRPGPNFSHHHQ